MERRDALKSLAMVAGSLTFSNKLYMRLNLAAKTGKY
ncbi:twin-arginine translocation signal domain-containing protein [Niabella sp. W65]|nr:twin-arginine translocation signal domain-containing protein [Niabella sp. W65]MCH7365368.1 twin-arginine translocation signal domain-containing protein [Niabella sp. W65]